MTDFLIHGNIPVSLYSNMLTFRDSKKSFKSDGDLLETMNFINSILAIIIHRIEKLSMSLDRK